MNVLGFVEHMLSVPTTQFFDFNANAALDNI